MKKNNTGFSIIEIIVGIFIFTIGLTGVYVLLVSSISMNEYSKNSIIAYSLAQESIEDIVNLRDNNYTTFNNRNKLPGNDVNNKISTGVYYKVSSDISAGEIVKFDVITPFEEGKDKINSMSNYKLYLTPEKIYTYESSGNTPTYFYRYVKFDDLYEDGKYITGSLKLTSKVIWYSRGYHEIKLDTIITDFRRN